MCLVQEHSAATQVRLEPAAPQSQVKHSSTELPEPNHVWKNHAWPAQHDYYISHNVGYMETVWILINWLFQKPTDLDLQC